MNSNNPNYSSAGGVLFNKSLTTLILFPYGLTGSYTIPSTVTSIGDYAFGGIRGLTSVTIPGSVTNIGSYAFESSGLSQVYFLGNAPSVNGASGGYDTTVFEGASGTAVYLSGTTGWGATFGGWPTVPISGIAGDFPFLINNGAITITGYIGSGGKVVIPDAINGYPVIAIGFVAFWNQSVVTSIKIPNSVSRIDDGAFYGCSGLTSMTLPNSLTSIGYATIANCSGLTNVTIPNSVTNIGDWAFMQCSGLTAVVIPNSVTSIGSYAYFNCLGLASVTIPSSVIKIGDNAFRSCSGLQSVYFQGNAPNGITGSLDTTIFTNSLVATVFYLPGTTGWGATFGGRPTALWYQPQPQILGYGPGFGVQSNGFQFTISWATNTPVVVEASTNLLHPAWRAVKTNTLTGGTAIFSDPQWANYPNRFYRLRSQ